MFNNNTPLPIKKPKNQKKKQQPDFQNVFIKNGIKLGIAGRLRIYEIWPLISINLQINLKVYMIEINYDI